MCAENFQNCMCDAVERIVDAIIKDDGDTSVAEQTLGKDYVLFRKLVCEYDLTRDEYKYLAGIMRERAKNSIAFANKVDFAEVLVEEESEEE